MQLLEARKGVLAEDPELMHHVSMCLRLTTEGMSSDEDEGDVSGRCTYSIIKKKWRSPDVKRFFNIIDAYRRSTKSAGYKGRDYRHWAPSDKVSTSAAVPGLPKNFYDEAWLATQPHYVVRRLQIDPVEYSLTIPSDIESAYEKGDFVDDSSDDD
ncbi:hypothetical protein FRB99_004740 [Tulasnella sp. 403]|nr:hypothetical protein FRB99_004740 [Tulasnella sp. 403]